MTDDAWPGAPWRACCATALAGRRAHQPRQGARRPRPTWSATLGSRACALDPGASTGASSSASCRRTTPRRSARRSSPPAPGVIGGYVHCSFATPARARSSAAEGASPAVGEMGVEEAATSCASRSSCRAARGGPSIDAYVAAHPTRSRPSTSTRSRTRCARSDWAASACSAGRRPLGELAAPSRPVRPARGALQRRPRARRCAASPACPARAPRSSTPPRPRPTCSSPAT